MEIAAQQFKMGEQFAKQISLRLANKRQADLTGTLSLGDTYFLILLYRAPINCIGMEGATSYWFNELNICSYLALNVKKILSTVIVTFPKPVISLPSSSSLLSPSHHKV